MNYPSRRLDLLRRALCLIPPGTPGKARLARTMLGAALQAQDVSVQAWDRDIYLVPSLAEPIAFYLFVDGVYEAQATRLVLSRLAPGATFVDVGANVGVFTIPAARRVGSTGRVLAVEPSPRVFPYLEHNVCANGLSKVCLEQCAAYDRDAPGIPFWEAPGNHFGMGALAAQFGEPPTLVRAATLDRLLLEANIGRVDVLKVDVEGFEAAVFRGTERLLSSPNAPLIVFEFCDWAEARVPGCRVGDAQQVLFEYGYRIWRLDDFTRGRSVLTDVLTQGFEVLVAAKRAG